jgi:uncharacterized membrane protein
MFLWMVWNLFLAAIPVSLGYAALALGRQARKRSAPWLWLALAPVLALWLIFLPNSCYLFTELRHTMQAIEAHHLWSQARGNPAVTLHLGLLSAIAAVYITAGALTFALSIRPVKQLARMAGLSTAWWAVPFFVLVSLGVYLGLVVRYNSWDLLTRPAQVLETVTAVADRPRLIAVILLFALFLWLVYEVNDIWLDGFALRWQRWSRREEKGAPDDPVSLAGRL